jgi:hypothetical protein
MDDIESLARRLYEHGTRSAPTWDQIGQGTRGEWLKMAQRHAAGDTEWWSVVPRKPVEPQGSLF